MFTILRRWMIAVLLAAWSFPTAAEAGAPNRVPAPIAESAPATERARGEGAGTAPDQAGDETQRYAAREEQAQALRDFQGGSASIYIGGGALTVILLVILIVILV